MAETKLLSVIDENTILITERFEIRTGANKVGETTHQYYDIDLILDQEITLDQLLEATLSVLQQKAGVPQALCRSIDAVCAMREDQLEAFFRDLAQPRSDAAPADPAAAALHIYREDSRTPESEQRAAGPEPDLADEDAMSRVCLRVLLECLRRFYAAPADQSLPACRGDYVDSAGFGSARQVHLDRGFLNGRRLADQEPESIADPDQIWLTRERHGSRSLESLGFVTSSCLTFAISRDARSAELYCASDVTEAFREKFPLYNISDQPLYRLDHEPVKIIPPGEPPRKNRQSLAAALLSPLLMAAAMILIRVLSAGSAAASNPLLILSYGAMGLVAVVIALINLWNQARTFRAAQKEWRVHYEEYIRKMIRFIREKQKNDVDCLMQLYPPVIGAAGTDPDARSAVWREPYRAAPGSLLQKAEAVSGEIFSRGPDHPDFLAFRLGCTAEHSSLVPSVFAVQGEQKDAVFSAARYKNLDSTDSAPFSIVLPLEDARDTEGYLIDLPAALAHRYACLAHAPVVLRLKQCGTLGVVFPQGLSFGPFMENLLFQLCFYHSPADVQFILFCRESDDWRTQQETISALKHLPHFRELLGELSPFAFNRDEADQILNRLERILSARQNAEAADRLPHIVFLIEEEYGLKRHPVAGYLPKMPGPEPAQDAHPDCGISFVFCKRYREDLPPYCGQVITAEPAPADQASGTPWRFFLRPHVQDLAGSAAPRTFAANSAPLSREQAARRYEYVPDVETPAPGSADGQPLRDAVYRAFKMLSALFFYRVAQNAEVPHHVDLYDLCPELRPTEAETDPSVCRAAVGSRLSAYISRQWGVEDGAGAQPLQDVTRSLAVPIGLKYQKKNSRDAAAVVSLDLGEKADGPHLIGAGTTGSGKTESLLTYLVLLCILFSPEQINLLLLDLKGGGFTKRLNVPHVVGSITNIDSDKSGADTIYLLKRFEQSMQAEVQRREQLLSQMGVDRIDAYIEARRKLDLHITEKLQLDPERDKDRIAALRALPPMPHLFVVVDEFSELMKISADHDSVDFKSTITSLARVGRSLGIHLILVSQNIEGAITDDIRLNVQGWLCMKVATRAASRDMIGTDDAASPTMPGNGRAYLKSTNGRPRFDYFQMAYTGNCIVPDPEKPVQITQVNRSGPCTPFFDSREWKDTGKPAATQLELAVEQLQQVAQRCYAAHRLETPHPVYQPPLPTACCCDPVTGRCVVL